MRIKPVVHFHYQCPPFSFTNRQALKVFLVKLARLERQGIDMLNYIFCTDEFLLELNRSYLKHDTLTDIITFPFSQAGQPIRSDIYISIDRVRENAQLFHTTIMRELHRVIFHGLLHLCSYQDKTAKQAQLMRSKEDFYLTDYFVPRGTS